MKPVYNSHLGDRDRSGRAAGEHIERELRELAPNAAIRFDGLAVTIKEIDDLELPTRPTKDTDSRAANSRLPPLGETPHRRWSRWKNCCFAAIRPPDRLDGLAFVYTDRYSRRVSTILGYPTSLLAMDRNFQKFLASVRQNPWRPDKNNQQTTFQLNGRQQRSRFGGPLHSVRNRFGRSPRHSAFAVAQAIGLDTKL